MCTSRTSYRDELNASVYSVSKGVGGAIADNPKLIDDYTPDMLETIWHEVESGNDDVRIELLKLLSDLDAHPVSGSVSRLRLVSSPRVAEACDAFLEKVPVSRAVPASPGCMSDPRSQRSREAAVMLRMLTLRNPHLDLGGGLNDD